MKNVIFLFLMLSVFASSQSIQKPNLSIIPSMHFGYSIARGEFILKNNAQEAIEFKQLIPEVYLGAQFMSDRWMVGFHYGFLQHSILLGAGVVLPIRKSHIKNKYY